MADAEEFIYVRLKSQDTSVRPGRVSRVAYDQIWQAKGFVVVDNDEAEAAISAPAAEPTPEPTKRKA